MKPQNQTRSNNGTSTALENASRGFLADFEADFKAAQEEQANREAEMKRQVFINRLRKLAISEEEGSAVTLGAALSSPLFIELFGDKVTAASILKGVTPGGTRDRSGAKSIDPALLEGAKTNTFNGMEPKIKYTIGALEKRLNIATDTDKNLLRAALAVLLKEGKVSKEGEKRATQYFRLI